MAKKYVALQSCWKPSAGWSLPYDASFDIETHADDIYWVVTLGLPQNRNFLVPSKVLWIRKLR